MNATELLAMYERVADAQDAVTKLRSFVLDLAVRGRLVPQVSHAATQKGGENEVAESLTLTCDLPTSWTCPTLEEVARYGLPEKVSSDKDVDGRTWILDLEDIEKGTGRLLNRVRASSRPFQSAKTRFAKGDVLFGKLRPYLCKVHVADEDGACTTEIVAIRPKDHLASKYLALVLRSPLTMNRVGRLMYGMKMPRLGTSDACALRVPLPPLEEQQRIVAKVDELMALCDQLEAVRTERESARDRLAAASLARLNAPDPDTFQSDAQFALNVLPGLTSRPDQIKQLRQTILNLAVRGKLSDCSDWSEMPVTLGSLATVQNGYAFKSEWFTKTGVRLLRNVNVAPGAIDWDNEACVPHARAPEFSRFLLAEGDVVLSLDRPFIAAGTKVARITAKDLPALLLQRVGRFVSTSELHPGYLSLWVNSPHFSEQIDPGRSNGVPHISSKQVEAAEIFFPPLAEQHRIVEKVDELLALCDELEVSLIAGESNRSRLLDALLYEALEPSASAAA
jgi:type I restriction enzyme S subunit